MNIRRLLSLFKDTFQSWQAHKAERLGAALAYYTIFSLAPLLIILIGITSLALGQENAQSQMVAQIQGLLGPDAAAFILSLVGNARRSGSGGAAALFGLGTLLVGALGLFLQLQTAINDIWDVKPDPRRGFRGAIRDRLVSLAIMLGVGFLLLVSLLVSTFLAAAGGYFSGLLPVPSVVLEAVNLVISLLFSTLLFAMLFKFLPDCPVDWGDVWHGAILTSLLFMLGKYLIAFYLGVTSVGSVYGTAGSLVALLVWVYYSAQLILFGAEFTHVYARKYRSGSDVTELAVSP